MHNVIVAWAKTNEKDFENHVPLKFVGNRNFQLGFSNNFHVLFLEGFEKLSESYRNSLKNLGYHLHDACSLFNEISGRYSVLDRFGDYEKKCFLRWVVIEKFFSGESIIHYDGDIVFNEDPKVIEGKLAGKTFILQGCPAFTVISDRNWFEQYQEQLDLFVKDIEGYSLQAWQQRDGWEVTFKTRWSGSRFREIITSDQDFISHLIHTGQLIQSSVEDISLALRDYVSFENPLFIHMYDDNFPYRYRRKSGVDYFTGIRVDGKDVSFEKKVLFWHMQSCFVSYLATYLMQKKVGKTLFPGRVNLNLSKGFFGALSDRFVKKVFGEFNRLDVYRYFFQTSNFSGILKDRLWWKKGIFY